MNSQICNSKRFFIHTLGCRVNQYESEAMRELLLKSDFKECLSKEIADIYIINTCTVTHRADKESRYLIGLFHRTNPKAAIVVTGCYAESNADDISFLPGVAHIIKNGDKNRIVDILNGSHKPVPGSRTPIPSLKITGFKDHVKAFVKIQDGCDNFCSYCKVPQVRGSLWSKPLDDIVTEVKGLVLAGFKEIILSGICLGAWGKDLNRGGNFPELELVDVLKALVDIAGDFRIRMSSIEPKYITDKLINFIASKDRICKHLHIPLQSGDDDILRKMNRPYTARDYKALIEKIRSKIENAAITTDVLIGFPGESDENFVNTLSLVRDIMPLRTHIFTFSPRKGTAAFSAKEELSFYAAKTRYHTLNVSALETSYLYRRRFIGKALPVLVESRRDKNTGLLAGYSNNYIRVILEGEDNLMRKIVPVEIIDISLLGTFGVYRDNDRN